MSCCFAKLTHKNKIISNSAAALIIQLNQSIFKALVDETILKKLEPLQKENLIQSSARFVKDLVQLLNDFYPKWIPSPDPISKNLATDIIITCLTNMREKLQDVEPIKEIIFSHYKHYLEKRIRTFNPNTEGNQSNFFGVPILKKLVMKVYKALFCLAVYQNEGYDQILLILPFMREKIQSTISFLTQAFFINFCLKSTCFLNFYVYLQSKKVIFFILLIQKKLAVHTLGST